jgi:hypothetical protein
MSFAAVKQVILHDLVANADRSPEAHRYSDELVTFASSRILFLPVAIVFLRTILDLPSHQNLDMRLNAGVEEMEHDLTRIEGIQKRITEHVNEHANSRDRLHALDAFTVDRAQPRPQHIAAATATVSESPASDDLDVDPSNPFFLLQLTHGIGNIELLGSIFWPQRMDSLRDSSNRVSSRRFEQLASFVLTGTKGRVMILNHP